MNVKRAASLQPKPRLYGYLLAFPRNEMNRNFYPFSVLCLMRISPEQSRRVAKTIVQAERKGVAKGFLSGSFNARLFHFQADCLVKFVDASKQCDGLRQ